MLVNTDGDVKNYYYTPWDSMTGSETNEVIDDRYGFANYLWDNEISMYYCNARLYDPILGRFTARDPVVGTIEDPMTLHAYLYCMDDPINHVDPKGLFYEHYDTEGTQHIIDQATDLVGKGIWTGPWEAFGAGGQNRVGEYDFAYNPKWLGDTFQLRDAYMSGGEFGNYLAGYTCYYNYGTVGEFGTRRFGDIYELSKSGHLDQPNSKYFISGGIIKAQADRGRAGSIIEKLTFVNAKFQLYYGLERTTNQDMLGNDWDRELNMFRQFWNNGRLR